MIKNPFPAILLALGAGGALCGVTFPATPAYAQWTVFDPSNYAQNLLTAARALEQVNNQIQSLQNEARMLANQAKNLSRIDFPQMKALEQRLQAIDRLIGQAQGIGYDIDRLDAQFRRQFPENSEQVLVRDLALTAKQQLQVQQLMAAQFRSQSLEQARRGQAEREARERTRRFLGDGKAYTPR